MNNQRKACDFWFVIEMFTNIRYTYNYQPALGVRKNDNYDKNGQKEGELCVSVTGGEPESIEAAKWPLKCL